MTEPSENAEILAALHDALPNSQKELVDTYLEGLEKGAATEDSLAAAILLLEQARMENRALRWLLAHPEKATASVEYEPIRTPTNEEPHKCLQTILGTKTFSRDAAKTTPTKKSQKPARTPLWIGVPSSLLDPKQPEEAVETLTTSGIRFLEIHKTLLAAAPLEVTTRLCKEAGIEPSVHIPGKSPLQERIALLHNCIECKIPRIICHPDALGDAETPLHPDWVLAGPSLLLENLDPRCPGFRTAEDLRPFLEQLPEAGICLDIAHAAREPEILEGFIALGKIREIHVSEINYKTGRHFATISPSRFREILCWLTEIPETPIILETRGAHWDSAVALAEKIHRRITHPNKDKEPA